jgi:hypothetical protein
MIPDLIRHGGQTLAGAGRVLLCQPSPGILGIMQVQVAFPLRPKPSLGPTRNRRRLNSNG